jgi:hypothetical protein
MRSSLSKRSESPEYLLGVEDPFVEEVLRDLHGDQVATAVERMNMALVAQKYGLRVDMHTENSTGSPGQP